RYSFLWTNFAKADAGTLVMGDAFAGGLYLPTGASLVVGIPDGYSVTSTDPASESSHGSILWYGPESFGAGEPQVTLAKTGASFPLIIGGIVAAIALAGAVVFIVLRKRKSGTRPDAAENPARERAPPGNEDTGSPATLVLSQVPEADLRNVEERVLHLLAEKGGELYQSDIVQQLALPKSTVSSALNGLHARGMIQKIKKGRENLIRLVK
ncbi:MAG: MarR family transcriptional regulator, partial [Methanoregulaceae archaeon]